MIFVIACSQSTLASSKPPLPPVLSSSFSCSLHLSVFATLAIVPSIWLLLPSQTPSSLSPQSVASLRAALCNSASTSSLFLCLPSLFSFSPWSPYPWLPAVSSAFHTRRSLSAPSACGTSPSPLSTSIQTAAFLDQPANQVSSLPLPSSQDPHSFSQSAHPAFSALKVASKEYLVACSLLAKRR